MKQRQKKQKQKKMKTMINCLAVACIMCCGLFTSSLALADDAQMRITLVKMVNQLEAMKPLITQAAREQDANARVRIHFDSWTDANGVKHNGLRQDIDAIQQALIHSINRQAVSPRVFTPIKNDFVAGQHV